MLRPALLLLGGLIAGCSLFENQPVLDIQTDAAAISIQNVSDQTVSYLALESEEAARIEFGGPAEWPTFGPDEGYHGPPDGIVVGLDEGDTEFLVYWSTGGGINRERVRL